MAIPDAPLTRAEQYLNRIATDSGTIPDAPLTRAEQYLNRIATDSGTIPDEPLTRVEQYLDYIAKNGSGGGGGSGGDSDLSAVDVYVGDYLSTTDLIITKGVVNRYQRYLVGN